MQLPRLIASNHAEAVAVLRTRRAALLDSAAATLDLAESFSECGYGDIADELIADAQGDLARAERHTPRGAA
ncbi:hypothetical protein A5768_07530 [Mycolicibacterium fortuitum]|uniref:hypothetical protein n=1 Tax=Mycolicibacterium fortuitum TaxID=1766 RepID=UPI0007EA3F50|nr:hypothetical protein [Mycolicibacterium fortuitum]OBG15220.1 hypothetical protein A5768_07530 [Mycolicibacterium fortuitum]